MHDAEALAIAFGPFEVVHQAPDEIAADVHAARDRIRDGDQVRFDVLAALLVVDAAGHDVVLVRRAVFRDEQGRQLVIAIQAQQQLCETLRRHFPTHVGHCSTAACRQRSVGAAGEDRRTVVIHADEVERLRDELRIAGSHCRCVRAEMLDDVRWVATFEKRVHVPPHEPAVFQSGVRCIELRVCLRIDGRQVQHDAHLSLAARRAHRL